MGELFDSPGGAARTPVFIRIQGTDGAASPPSLPRSGTGSAPDLGGDAQTAHRCSVHKHGLSSPRLVKDLFAIRIVLRGDASVIRCFELLALIHQTFKSVPGAIEDYIGEAKRVSVVAYAHTRLRRII